MIHSFINSFDLKFRLVKEGKRVRKNGPVSYLHLSVSYLRIKVFGDRKREDMSEEKASPCVLHIHGENIQVLPNAMFAIQYICLDPGEKPEVVSEKDVRPDPEPCDLLASYIQDEEVRHDFVKRIAQCPDVATLCQTVLTDLFNEVFCDCVEPAKLIKSKEFINAIIPLLPFKQGKSLRNIRRAIVKYVLGEG